MDIQQDNNNARGKYFYTKDGKTLAIMTYQWRAKDVMMIEHTEVDDVLRGKSAGKELVDRAVADARAQGFKILPACPYVKHVFEKDRDAFKDVWYGIE